MESNLKVSSIIRDSLALISLYSYFTLSMLDSSPIQVSSMCRGPLAVETGQLLLFALHSLLKS